jgi:hypothetical protein
MTPVALVVIEKSFAGRIWTNTHALLVPGEQGDELTDFGIATIVGLGGASIDDANTDPSNEDFDNTLPVITRLLAFERLMHSTSVDFTRVYVSDGKTPGVETGPFASISLSFAGLGTFATGASITQLNTILQINRVPVGFSNRPGRLQLRAALGKGEVIPGSEDGASIDPQSRPAIQQRLALALSQSNLDGLFGPVGDNDPVKYVIPKFVREGLPNAGAINGYTPVRTLVVADAGGRQTRRGRRRRQS